MGGLITTIDRYLLRSLVTQYLIALAIMISLYVVLDMFVNLDEFTEQGYPALTVAKNIFSYYWPNVFLYFAQLSGVITVFACMAVLARMRRLNELTAILSSGVSLYRVARPIVLFGLATTALLVVDTELLIPAVAPMLSRDHDDADGIRAYEVLFLKDEDDALLSAGAFNPVTGNLHELLVIRRDANGDLVEIITADRAEWEPPDLTRPIGRWRLERGRRSIRTEDESDTLGPRTGVASDFPLYIESRLSPDGIQQRQAEGWIGYVSLAQLAALEASGVVDEAAVLRTRHARIAAPLVSIVLLLLGLPFFLDRSPANVLGDAGKCMIACGLCYVTAFVAQSVRPDSVSAWPAWIPIFIFLTLAVVLLDRVKT